MVTREGVDGEGSRDRDFWVWYTLGDERRTRCQQNTWQARLIAHRSGYEERLSTVANGQCHRGGPGSTSTSDCGAGTGVGKSFAYIVPAILYATAEEARLEAKKVADEAPGEEAADKSEKKRPRRILISNPYIQLARTIDRERLASSQCSNTQGV